MAEPRTPPPGSTGEEAEPSLTRSYILIIVVQILVIGGLYWVSQHFS